jgi:hypothetical protein
MRARWLCDDDIDVKLGDALNGYKAEGKVATSLLRAYTADCCELFGDVDGGDG